MMDDSNPRETSPWHMSGPIACRLEVSPAFADFVGAQSERAQHSLRELCNAFWFTMPEDRLDALAEKYAGTGTRVIDMPEFHAYLHTLDANGD